MTDWFARPVLHVTDVEASLLFYVNRLGVSQIRWHRHHQQRKLRRMDNKSQTSSGKPNQSGLDLEKTISLRSRRKFFLGIPFL
jgi:hypothetical protein